MWVIRKDGEVRVFDGFLFFFSGYLMGLECVGESEIEKRVELRACSIRG